MIRHARALFAVSFLFAALFIPAKAMAAKTVVKSFGATTEGTTGGLFKTPRGVAVNQEGKGAASGTFYVLDAANNRIQMFNPAGEFLRTWGWGVRDGEAEFQVCKTAATCLAGTAGANAGQLNNPQAIAIDQATGNLFVSDQANRRIDVFGPNGAFQGAFGYGARTSAAEFQFCTTSCVAPATAGAQGGRFGAAMGGLSVDPTTGNLYFASKTNKRVDVFKPILTGSVVSNAEFLRAFGWDVETGGTTEFEVCTVAANCKAGSAGANPGQFGFTSAPADVAVDSEGNVYAVDSLNNKRVQKFSSAPAPLVAKFGETGITEAFGEGELLNIAVDPSSAPNRVLVSGRRSAKEDRIAVLELDNLGNTLHLHGEDLTPTGLTTGSTDIAVAKSTLGGNLYLTTGTPGIFQGVYALNEGPTIEAASGVSGTEANLNGTVVSNDAKVSYRFEYMPSGGSSWTKLPVADADAGTSSASAVIASTGLSTGTLTVKARGGAFTLSFKGETTAPLAHNASAAAVQSALEALASIGAGNVAVSGGPGSSDGSTPYAISLQGALVGTEVTEVTAFAANLIAPTTAVSKVATGLKDGTKYLARLVATRPAGGFALTTTTTEFTTLALPPAAPSVSAATASAITDSTAKLEGTVNPKKQATSYQFEYLTQAAYEANGNSFTGPEVAAKAPASPVSIGSGSTDIAVAEQIEGLDPSTSYRFRLSASNETGTTNGSEASFITYAGAQAFDPCANDAFRAGLSANLPDCRAYEQASPVDKNGGSIQATPVTAHTAEDGSTITFESTTGVPGGAGAQNFPTYMAKRSSSGWSTTGLLPNPSSGERAATLGWTPDFGTVFDLAELFGGDGVSMLARSTADGVQTEIVPHTSPSPEYGYVDSSADGDITIFEAKPGEGSGGTTLQLTPDAAPGKLNIYAWDRDSAELRLAGVLPDGTTPPQGSVIANGMDAEEYNRDSHVVSDDGSVFFNDPETGQLYLRLNPAAEETAAKDLNGDCVPDPILACTVHISASQKKNGKGVGKTDAAGPHPAQIKSASVDGSTVTFTSSEKLTDDANTGPEPDPPAIARANVTEPPCSPAPCEEELGFIPTFANEIAIDEAEGYVYWSDPESGRIGRAKLDGKELDEDYVTGLGKPLGIAVIDEAAAKYIFWTDRGPLNEKGEPQAGKGTIGRVDLDGTDMKADCYEGLSNPRSIVVDSSHIYWSAPKDLATGSGSIEQAGLDDCDGETSMEVLYASSDSNSGASGDLAIDSTHIYFSAYSPGLFGTNEIGYIYRVKLDGTELKNLGELKGTKNAPGLALDANHLYWSVAASQTITRANLDGSSPEPSFIAEASRPEDMARVGEHLFWVANQGAVSNPGTDIYQLDRESGVLTDLAPDGVSERGTEVQGVLGASEDGSYVYFAANGVPDDLDNASNDVGESAEPGTCKGVGSTATGICNLYVAHRTGLDWDVDFISRLNAQRLGTGREQGDSANWVGGHGEVNLRELDKSARVSTDGRVLVFRSRRQLTDYDNEGPHCVAATLGDGRIPGPCLELYRFDYEEMHIACMSCDPRGAAPEGPAGLTSVTFPNTGGPRPAATLARNLSADGGRFFFETRDALVARDTNGLGGCPASGSPLQELFSTTCQDVYEWEAPGTGSCSEGSPAYSSLNEGCIYLISTGKGKEGTFFADADLDGDNVFIYTYEQLVPQDTDDLFDAYDVRVGGGLAAQHAVEPPPCTGEACRTEPIAPPPSQSPSSSGFSGPTDLQPKRGARKAKKKHRKNKRHKRKAKKQAKQRAAKQSGRAGR